MRLPPSPTASAAAPREQPTGRPAQLGGGFQVWRLDRGKQSSLAPVDVKSLATPATRGVWRQGYKTRLQWQGCNPSWDQTGHGGANLQAHISPYTLAHAWGRGKGRTSAPKERPIQESRRGEGRKSPGGQPRLGQARDAWPGESESGTVRLSPSNSNAGDLTGGAGGPRPQTPLSASRTSSPAAAAPAVSARGPRFRPFPHPSRRARAPSALQFPGRPRLAPPPCPTPPLGRPCPAPRLRHSRADPAPTPGLAPPRAFAIPGQAPPHPLGRPRPAASQSGAGPAPCFRWLRQWRRRASAIEPDPTFLGARWEAYLSPFTRSAHTCDVNAPLPLEYLAAGLSVEAEAVAPGVAQLGLAPELVDAMVVSRGLCRACVVQELLWHVSGWCWLVARPPFPDVISHSQGNWPFNGTFKTS
ncbi:unnamed protein product [Rangifer tarandus platyrhynchus]|uniref:Uncharacterized protein n=2 Tax=Rangifer tarandus platyrhynchus TaxID=3082113 RepID=A0ABN8YY52_RANTA|nr:unnamed protein product [Rangifer tarandus platyrhynchus]CAI9693939.1 unnamed protein product [Rangifer tarandus platyrhynchus]